MARQAIEQRHVTQVLDVQKKPGYGYRSYGDDFTQFAELACREVHEYKPELLRQHPHDYVSEYTALMASMQPETQRHAVSAILNACEPLTLTWSYIRIAQLVDKGWVDTILTTNLDLVLLETLSLFSKFPAICDYHEAAVLRSSHAGEPQIIYLHGNRNSYNVRNTDPAVGNYSEHMRSLLRGLLDDRILLVSGYSGWNDGLMQILKKHFDGMNVKRALYWAFAGQRPQTLPLGKADHVWYLEEAPAASLFEQLARLLKLPPAPLVADPIGHFVSLIKRIEPEASDVMAHDVAGVLRQLEMLREHNRAAASEEVLEAAQRSDDHALRAAVKKLIARAQRLEPSQIAGLIVSILGGTEMRGAESVSASVTALLDEISQQPDFAASPDWDEAFRQVMGEGDRQKIRGSLTAALVAYDAGQALARGLATRKPDNTQWQRDLSVSYDNIGDVRTVLGELPLALQAYEERLRIARDLAHQDPANHKFQRDVAVSLERMGDVRKAQGHLPAALKVYEERLDIARKLADQNPNNTEWQRDLSVSYNKIGDMRMAKEEFTAALDAYENGLRITRKLVDQNADNTVWQRDLSVSYNKIGDVLEAQNNLSAALDAYEKGWQITRKLADHDPDNTVWQRDLSISLGRIGEVRKAQKKLPAALEAYERALGIHEELARRDPKNTRWARDHAMCHEDLSAVHSMLGNRTLARQNLQESLSIMERLVVLDPSNAQWARDVKNLRGKLQDGVTPDLPIP